MSRSAETSKRGNAGIPLPKASFAQDPLSEASFTWDPLPRTPQKERPRGLSRRNCELLLLLAAAPVVLLLFVLATLGLDEDLGLMPLAVPLGLIAAFLAAHLATRFLAPGADPALLPLAFALSGIGIAFVMRLAPELAERQVIWLFVGIATMVLTLLLVRSVKKLGEYKYTILLVGLICLILPAVVGVEIGGSKIWLSLGGLSFQPGEIAKVCIVLFLAGYLAENREMLSVSGRRVAGVHIPDLRTLVPLLVMWGISLLLVVFEKDLGSALLFFGLFVVMLFVSTGRISFVIFALVLAAIGAVGAWFVFDHVQTRVDIWLDPFASAQGSGLQLVQSLYSLADGDLLGTGIGRGYPTFIAIVESDFIFVAMAEEMGFLGAAGILLLFILVAVRGLTAASRAASDTEAFAATGLTTALVLQAFVIVGGTTMLIPLTGVTLPFMSQGGSSLLASFIIIGLLLRISDSGTGLERELQATINLDGGVLGRLALGKRLTALITTFCLLFGLLFINLGYHMVWAAPEIRALSTNTHTMERLAGAQRGAIVSSDGVILAQSVADENGTYTRVYPQGSMAAHIIGYSSARFGSSGVEGSQAEQLLGRTGYSNWNEALNALAGIQNPGNDVKLTLDSRLQNAAQDALSGYTGAAIMLDASTGAVLANASSPTFDLNNAEALLEEAGRAEANGVAAGSIGPLFSSANQGTFSPGSTFKIITLAAALYSGGIKLSDSYESPGTLEIGGGIVSNFGGNNYGTVSVERGFALSSNTVFAQLATKIGAATLVSVAESFGFNHSVGLDFYVAPSPLPNPATLSTWETAWLGAGEDKALATPVQMALVCAAFANNGTIMNPYVVQSISAADGTLIATTKPEVYGNVASAEVVAQVNQALEAVVATGTATEAQIAGYTVRGKSGTAEVDGQTAPNSWFVGYVEVKGRPVVVALLLCEAEEGAATPRARDLLQEAINVL